MLDDINRKINNIYDNTELRICKKISDDAELQKLCDEINIICDEYLVLRIVMHFRKFVFRLLSEQQVLTIRIPMLGTILTYENCIKGRQLRFKKEANKMVNCWNKNKQHNININHAESRDSKEGV